MEDEEVAESWEEAADSGVRNITNILLDKMLVWWSASHIARIGDQLDVCGA